MKGIDRFNTLMTFVLVVFIMFSGCATGGGGEYDTEYESGSTVKELTDASEMQDRETKIISGAAKAAKVNKDKPKEVVKHVDNIIKSNDKLKTNVKVLSEEAAYKEKALAEIAGLKAQLENKDDELEDVKEERDNALERLDGVMAKISFWFMLVGGVAIPAGIVLCFKVEGQFIWLSIGGAALIVSAQFIQWLNDNWEWIAGSIAAAVAIAAWRMYKVQDDEFNEVVETSEMLKEEVKKLPANRSKTVPNPDEVLAKIFGDKHTDGASGVVQSARTRKKVLSARKKLGKRWAPTIS